MPEQTTTFSPPERSATDHPDLNFQAHLLSDCDELEHCLHPWERLAEMAIRPNPCFDPDFLIPAIRHLADAPIRVLIVTSQPKKNPTALPVFCGLMPLSMQKTGTKRTKRSRERFKQINESELAIWQHELCHDCTPLLRREVASETLEFMLNHLRYELQTDIVMMKDVAAEGPFADSLKHYLETFPSEVLFSQQTKRYRKQASADFQPETPAEVNLADRLNLMQKLSMRGEVKTTMAEPSDSEIWVDEFLRLNASGIQTPAMQETSSHDMNRFFREMTSRMLAYGKMKFYKTTLSKQPIAMACDITHQHGRMTPTYAIRLKTAYQHSLHQYLPILLPELDSHETASQPNLADQFLSIRFSLRDSAASTEIPAWQKLKHRLRQFKI